MNWKEFKNMDFTEKINGGCQNNKNILLYFVICQFLSKSVSFLSPFYHQQIVLLLSRFF
jgi:hypothetical protein